MRFRWVLSALLAAAWAPAMATADPSELAGTSWRLVEILWMDDRSAVPGDPSKYTLELRADGSAAIGADCNRGSGTWTSESAGKIEFGPLASTRAMCPPGSLSDEYLSQIEWVRSYVLKDRDLYLATMADGSILELAPLDEPSPAVAPREPSEQPER